MTPPFYDASSSEDFIRAIFSSHHPAGFNPSDCHNKCRAFLQDLCELTGPDHLCSTHQAQDVCNAFGFAASLFLQHQSLQQLRLC